MPVHVIVKGGANELVGELIYKALEKAGLSVDSWANCSEDDFDENVEKAIENDCQVVVTALYDGE